LLYGINELNATLAISNKLVLLACNFIVKKSCTQVISVICIHRASCLTFHHVEHISLSRIVTGGEDVTVDQVPKEEHPSVEVGFDICGSSEDPNSSANQGKPRSI
jgi:hypothetical protein